jgi:hypothetical protein
MLLCADTVLNGSREIVVSAHSAAAAEPFLKRFRSKFLPDVTSFVLTDDNKGRVSKLTPLAEGRDPKSEPLAYLCQNFNCKLPARSPQELEAQLSGATS